MLNVSQLFAWLWQPKENNPGVYRIRNKVTSREYIGATTGPIRIRWDKHIGSLNRCRHANRLLQKDWAHYGADAFEFSVIEIVRDPNQVFERERYWQDKGYNHKIRYNPMNEANQRNYTAQTFRLRQSDLPDASPEDIDRVLNYFRTHTVTTEEGDQVIKALRESGNIR